MDPRGRGAEGGFQAAEAPAGSWGRVETGSEGLWDGGRGPGGQRPKDSASRAHFETFQVLAARPHRSEHRSAAAIQFPAQRLYSLPVWRDTV